MSTPGGTFPVVIVTGPVGIGKTTTAEAVGDLLIDHGVPHTMIDMDALTWTYPRPDDDQHNGMLGLRNLADLVRNARMVGSERLVVAGVVESESDRDDYLAAIPDAVIMVVRLVAPLDSVHERIARRHAEGRRTEDDVRKERDRAAELIGIMDAGVVPDLALDTTDLTPAQAARAVVDWLGWLPGA